MRRHRSRPAARRAAIAAVVGACLLGLGAPALAQTPTTPTTPPVTTAPPATTVPTTAPSTGTTLPSTATTVPTPVPVTTTSGGSDDGSSIPWVPIAVGVIALAVIVALVAMLSRRRGANRQATDDWRRRGADVTAEAGATARLLSTGTPASGQIAQQILGSLRAFEDLEQAAPDDESAADVARARRALQTLGLALDSDHQLRRNPQATPDQIAESAASLRATAGEADRSLRVTYRALTDTQ